MTSDLDPRIRRVFDALDDHDPDTAAAAFADSGTFYEVPRDESFNRDAYRAYLADVFETFPDYRVDEVTVRTTYPWATTLEWVFTGTHDGDAGWFDPTGACVELAVVSVVTVGDDGIESWRDYFDIDELDAQLGRE